MLFFRSTLIQFPPDARERDRIGGQRFGRVELDSANDQHACAALEAYADSCQTEIPWLAEALCEAGRGRPELLTQCAPTVMRVFLLAQARAAGHADYSHAAWEHVRAQLTAALAPQPVVEAGPGDPQRRFTKLHV